VEVEVEKPHIQHHRLGNKWLDLGLALVALFVSFISILIAYHHSKVMQELVHQNERLVEANSLPYLQISRSDRAGRGFTLNATNEGVGPARIVNAEILVDGRPVQTIEELVDACCGKGDYSGFAASSLEGRMVRPGDTVTYIDFRPASANDERLAALTGAGKATRISTRLCYCSVFDDCWVAASHDPTPNPVKTCVPPAHPYRE
jgi:hypothetical protein